jgi:phosphate transport system permease protein
MKDQEILAMRRMIARARARDLAFALLGVFLLVMGLSTIIVLVLDMATDGAHRLGWDFLSSFPSRNPEKAGILSAWVGTLLVMTVTATVAVAIGVAAGIYLEEFASRNWLTWLIEVNVTNLAGVPSIVYGLLALGVFVYWLELGESILTAGLTLALLILPVIIVATREAIRAVPQSIREAAFAVGASPWKVATDHVLPYSTGGILTGVILGMARAIGETAPIVTIGALTFIAFLPPAPISGEAPFVSFEWLSSPFTVMPIQMFNWVSRPQEAFHENAAAAGIVLMALMILVNSLAIAIRIRFRRRLQW